jgi:hypothetical protein
LQQILTVRQAAVAWQARAMIEACRFHLAEAIYRRYPLGPERDA